jgi:hypothetical protein
MQKRFLNTLAASAAIALAAASAAQAQSSSGNIEGEAAVGETIVVHGPDNGFHREIHIEKDGKFTIRRVPTGEYTVVRMAPDGSAGTAQTVYIKVGSTARVQ